MYCDLPFDAQTEDVIMQRIGAAGGRVGDTHFNIPKCFPYDHDYRDSSPTGFEWGYLGSGPTDFALNILYWFTRDKHFAYRHRQEFKVKFVARVPALGGTIAGADVRGFIAGKRAEDDAERERVGLLFGDPGFDEPPLFGSDVR